MGASLPPSPLIWPWQRSLSCGFPGAVIYWIAWCVPDSSMQAQVLADPVTHRVIAVDAADFCDKGPWQLVFEDEFNGTDLDTTKWLRYYPYCWNGDDCLASRAPGWPDDMSINVDENVEMTGSGTVKLTARKGGPITWYGATTMYTSGMLHSRMRFTRGRFECRMKVPLSTSHHLWPAFWLFGGDPMPSEIDILEITGDHSDQYHHALHRWKSGVGGRHASDEATLRVGEMSADFHVYRADWDRWFVNFYIDDVLIARSCRMYDLLNRPVSSCQVPGGIYIQNQAFPAQDAAVSVIISMGVKRDAFSTAMGGAIPVPDLPAVLEVDYVRVYER